jgi:hypothetical protein
VEDIFDYRENLTKFVEKMQTKLAVYDKLSTTRGKAFPQRDRKARSFKWSGFVSLKMQLVHNMTTSGISF